MNSPVYVKLRKAHLFTFTINITTGVHFLNVMQKRYTVFWQITYRKSGLALEQRKYDVDVMIKR